MCLPRLHLILLAALLTLGLAPLTVGAADAADAPTTIVMARDFMFAPVALTVKRQRGRGGKHITPAKRDGATRCQLALGTCARWFGSDTCNSCRGGGAEQCGTFAVTSWVS